MRKKLLQSWGVVLVLLMCSVCMPCHVYGNNVRILGAPVVSLSEDNSTVSLSFYMSWDNSWRDEFNWDAVWLFGKYKVKDGNGEWRHLMLSEEQTPPKDFVYEQGYITGKRVGGLFVKREKEGRGDVVARNFVIKAPLASFGGVSAAEIAKRVIVHISGIEMVYVPRGGYALGDGTSYNSLEVAGSSLYGEIPDSENIVSPTYVITASASGGTTRPENLADRINNPAFSNATSWYSGNTSPCWWKIDFGEDHPRTIRYFGVSIATGYLPASPTTPWFLEGSNDDAEWKVLSVVSHTFWQENLVSYPVQRSVYVEHPDAYRYYRLNFPAQTGIRLQNVAMTESDIYQDIIMRSAPVIQENDLQINADGTSYALRDEYPKGYNSFYCMRYEVSQEQYADFLNMLSREQQAERIGKTSAELDELERGDYLFGLSVEPSYRNGLCIMLNNPSKPAVFACNLENDDFYNGPEDGQTLACNYLTPADMLAYSDWACLRPMSELEFEKVCRKPYPEPAIPGEFAWNAVTIFPLSGLNDLMNIGSESEKPQNNQKNVNAGTPSLGPVRCGAFARSGTNQQQAGASYWGVMDMSGNVSEICYSIKASGFNTSDIFTSHGDGDLTSIPTGWPSASVREYFILKGGSFASASEALRVSDRSGVLHGNMRDSTVGFRAVRSFSGDDVEISPGKISGKDTVCLGTIEIENKEDAYAIWNSALARISYSWFIKKSGSAKWQLIPGEDRADLIYRFEDLGQEPYREYIFRRKAECIVGEDFTEEVKVLVLNLKIEVLPEEAILGDCGITLEAFVYAPDCQIRWEYNNQTLATTKRYVPLRQHFDGECGYFEMNVSAVSSRCTTNLRLPITIECIDFPALEADCGSTFTDNRPGGKSYSVGLIGSQCWMFENMNIGDFLNPADGLINYETHKQPGIQKLCYGHDEENCGAYGALYNWEEAVFGGNADGTNSDSNIKYVTVGGKRHVQGICPDGWHIPGDEEWECLVNVLGGEDNAAVVMKSTEGWISSGNATNSSGFSALPGGMMKFANSRNIGLYGYWWSSTQNEKDRMLAFGRHIMGNSSAVYRNDYDKENAYSIRCIKNR